MPEPPEPRALTRYRRLATLLDARFRLPGTPLRFGWDGVLGLLPGVGDAAGSVAGGYGLWAAYRLGAPGVVLARMVMNLALDFLFGAVPLLGDLADLGWRGNLRNLALLEQWYAEPARAARRSSSLFLLLLGALGALLAAAGVLLLWAVRTLVAGA